MIILSVLFVNVIFYSYLCIKKKEKRKDMGILNDIVKRDLNGGVKKEDEFEVYFPNNNHGKCMRLLKREEYHGVNYTIMTSGDYPFIDITVMGGNVGTDNYVEMNIRDRMGRIRTVHVKRIEEFGGYDNWKIVYNSYWDYIPRVVNGQVHTVESLTEDAESYIDQILQKKFEICLEV